MDSIGQPFCYDVIISDVGCDELENAVCDDFLIFIYILSTLNTNYIAYKNTYSVCPLILKIDYVVIYHIKLALQLEKGFY